MQPSDLSGPDPLAGQGGAGVEQLQRIVERARRRRWRFTAGGVVAALAAGAGVGYLVSVNTSSGQTVLAGGTQAAAPSTTVAGGLASPAVAPYASGGAASGGPIVIGPLDGSLTRIFVRTTGDVTIRGFVPAGEVHAAEPSSGCPVYPLETQFSAEVSTPGMVGTADSMAGGLYAPSGTSGAAVREADATEVGQAEGDPVYVVVVHTSSNVGRVGVTFAGGGTDSMSPVDGWSALVSSSPRADSTSIGKLEALSADGKVLQSSSISIGYNGPDVAQSPPAISACCSQSIVPPSAPSTTVPGSTGGGATGSSGGGTVSSSGASASAGASPAMSCDCAGAAKMPCVLPALVPAIPTPGKTTSPTPTTAPINSPGISPAGSGGETVAPVPPATVPVGGGSSAG